MKESKFYNRTQTTNILLLPTSRNLLTRPRASSETTDSFFLEFFSKYKHSRLCIFKFLWKQLNDHQVLQKIPHLIILSLCEGKLLIDLTRDSHKQQYEQPLKCGQGLPYIPKAKHKTLKRFNELGLSWTSVEKRICPKIRLIQPKLRARPRCIVTSTLARFQLYIKDTTLSKSKQD